MDYLKITKGFRWK